MIVLAGLCVLGAVLLGGRRRPRPLVPVERRRRPGRAGRREAVDRSAQEVPLALDLLAAVMRSGAPPTSALALVGAALADAGGGRSLARVADELARGVPEDAVWAAAGTAWAPLRRALQLSATTGAPVAALLLGAADDARRERARAGAVAAARLGVRVVVPLGLCALPGFALLGVAPVVLSLAADLLAG